MVGARRARTARSLPISQLRPQLAAELGRWATTNITMRLTIGRDGSEPRQGQERWKEISVDRLFAAKIVTSGESQGRPAHYLHS